MQHQVQKTTTGSKSTAIENASMFYRKNWLFVDIALALVVAGLAIAAMVFMKMDRLYFTSACLIAVGSIEVAYIVVGQLAWTRCERMALTKSELQVLLRAGHPIWL